MRTDLTFTIVKPTAFEKNYLGPIIEIFNRNGFKIKAMKLTRMSYKKAKEFYAEHESKPFFESVLSYMTSGPVVVAVLQKALCLHKAGTSFRNFRVLCAGTLSLNNIFNLTYKTILFL